MSEVTTKQDIIARAMRDSVFRAALIQDPKGTLEGEFGIAVPAGVDVIVVEELPTQVYLVLPPTPESRELSDQELDQLSAAVGGTCGHCRLPISNTGSVG